MTFVSDMLMTFDECEPSIRALTHSRTPVLQCVAVCCSVLQCVAVCCSVLQCVAAINKSPHPLTDCDTLHHTATQCNTSQHTATHRNTLQHTTTAVIHTQRRSRIQIATTIPKPRFWGWLSPTEQHRTREMSVWRQNTLAVVIT